ncbi:hypothetical protein ASPZODRAFT_167030 [Penicilliopsis zonata CBS 506.65]|uniref:Aminoglycoside phosphotransferase domain-containing protein n=1 Tax=Penicilliopsis zonata CBS 506.65 TaxID=1073090 RepID=A0A1L9SFY5_9EURO|nr:hypothetical protein ASPZODRAFT_167030 [Penicilliopsis zonata CBS 506.65]OJJ45997.1 hypothetical protein ASPZODRAFT_167030 [Penicilliopsis zonata CBS 506.65]
MAISSTALEMISSASLSPTEHLLLNHFVERAVDPDLAAQYLVSRVSRETGAGVKVEACLRSFKQDLRNLASKVTTFDPIPEHLDTLVRRRDGPSCCMTTKLKEGGSFGAVESAYIIPPSMIKNLTDEDSSILEAFLSPQGVRQLKLLVESGDPLRNLWCLSPSIHKAFRQGHVEIRTKASRMAGLGYSPEECSLEKHKDQVYRQIHCRRVGVALTAKYILEQLYPEKASGLFYADGTKVGRTVGMFKMSTEDPTLSLPSSFLIEVHYRFANALHLFSIEEKIALGWPKQRKAKNPGFPNLSGMFYYLSRLIPLSLRMRLYLFLWPIGNRIWGSPGPTWGPSWIQRLPFNLMIKECIRAPQSEPNALRLVKRYTTIPAPRIVDVGEHKGKTYLVMTLLPGQPLSEVAHLMSYAERDQFADDLADCVAQMRTIPNQTGYRFANTLGGPVVDHRIPDGQGGPFNSEADFNNHLTSHLGCTPDEILDGLSMRQDHRSFFTHADFFGLNLLVDRGRLSGIVDWECAGYMPEYWEYIKAKRAAHCSPVLEAIFARTFGSEYTKEWEIERKLWRLTPFGV